MNKDRDDKSYCCDALWLNVNLATMPEASQGYGKILDAAIAVNNSRIVWLGKQSDLPDDYRTTANAVYDGEGRWLTPGLIDCHTHLVYGGHRAKEFEMRLQGASYQEIAEAGGGIRSTVSATRAATEEELVTLASTRLEALLAEGVTTVEIKSGYGLDLTTELSMLRAARRLQQMYPVNVSTTFLGAHAVPEEYAADREGYISLVCDQMLPAVVNEELADSVDVFCESIGFSYKETEHILLAATKLGLSVKVHADQLGDSGGAGLAAKYKALSADHIEYSSRESIEAMAEQGTVGVILPGAFYYLREQQSPPIEALRENNVPIAIATDSNPGSSPTTSLLLMMNMACTFFHLTPEEVLAGVTINAARALGVNQDRGSLELGKRADFALWNISDPAELCYWIGANHCSQVVKDGLPTATI